VVAFAIRRILGATATILGGILVVFLLLRASGDPVLVMAAEGLSRAQAEQLREEMGYNDPLPLQYFRIVGNMLRGDFGYSLYHRRPAMEVVVERLPATALLVAVSLGIAAMIGIPLGIYTAVHAGSAIDKIVTALSLLGRSSPVFVSGFFLILLFSVYLKLLPASGSGGLAHLIMPSLALAAFQSPVILRFTRSSLLEVLKQDYVNVARSKGLSERVVIYKHVLRNASAALVTMLGLQIAALFGGTVISETVFAWPGMGRLIVLSVLKSDHVVMQALSVLWILIIISANTLVDLTYGFLDPRVRMD
jgi:ABC-type dipeptide/oligopeptide/nickel transport system permease component